MKTPSVSFADSSLKEGAFRDATAKASLFEGGGAKRRREFPRVLRTSKQRKPPMSLPYKKELIPRAKELRKVATKQENRLWYDFLRSYPVRFQRQKAIKSFIADFYCHKAKLIVELDGSQHFSEQGLAYDAERGEILSSYGLQILRFSNAEIEHHFKDVCIAIDQQVQKRMGGLTP